MTLAALRRRAPQDPDALAYFSLIAAAGFFVGWASQTLAGLF